MKSNYRYVHQDTLQQLLTIVEQELIVVEMSVPRQGNGELDLGLDNHHAVRYLKTLKLVEEIRRLLDNTDPKPSTPEVQYEFFTERQS